ncbi:MAG: secondary thiamine-phosphate synthase enzyme YjbQ [Bacillota bacterium]|nr:secondary thiamine-phosphate synthase enzyme YjbQ [Bacillota bacterium]
MKTIEFSVRTSRKEEWVDITRLIDAELAKMKTAGGLCHIFVSHTTAGITINENADPDVMEDLFGALARMVPRSGYRHAEGNSEAHIKASLVGSAATIALQEGELQLGRWQGIYLCEFDGPRTRSIRLTVIEG